MIKRLDVLSLLKQFTLHELTTRDDIVIVDVREPDEYSHEHISEAINIPLNQLCKINTNDYKDKIAIFHCRSGSRTQMNEHVLDNAPFREKYCISGGISQWKAANLPTISKHSAPIDVMRQVQLIVSIMILLGVGLSFLSPYFILLTVAAGLGLFIAGLTGFCGMAEILKFLPWNKPTK